MRLQDLFEAPIEDINHVGDWNRSSSFDRAPDRKLLTNPKAIQKIIKMWEKTPVPFQINFVNHAEGRLWMNREAGKVSLEELKKNMPRVFDEIKIDPNAINIIYTNNGGGDWVPLTGWMMAHRFCHTLVRSKGDRQQVPTMWDARDILWRTTSQLLAEYGLKTPEYYDHDRFSPKAKEITNFFYAIGTMRSARNRQLSNPNEFFFELFAQYMMTGSIKFKPLPKQYKSGRIYRNFRGNENDLEYHDISLETLAETLPEYFEDCLRNLHGSIFVM